MNKDKLILPLVMLVVFATYCTVLFLVNTCYDASFWLSFAFIVIAFLFVAGAFTFVSKPVRSRQVVGMPVTVLTCLYLAVEVVLGTLFMFIGNVPVVWSLIPQLLLFAVFVICFIPAILSSKNYKDEQTLIAEQNAYEQQNAPAEEVIDVEVTDETNNEE